MSSSHSPSAMVGKPSDSVDSQVHDHEEESIADSFICCVCLDLLYKPIVLGCGHVSCFWCIHKSMDGLRESHCPVCRNPYYHFPTICEMLHFLLLKIYPVAYKRRAKQILEEEKEMDCFSPELDPNELNSVGESAPPQDANNLSRTSASPCHAPESKDFLNVGSSSSAAVEENSSSVMNYNNGACSEFSITDVLCPACNQILFRPVVLNCGHVYCEACIIVPEDGIIICKACGAPHPTDFPKVCLELNNFLEEKFPGEYAVQRRNVEPKQAQFQTKNSDAGSDPNKSAKTDCPRSLRNGEDFLPWRKEHGSKIHMGVGCDCCGMLPIVGDRYRCLDCKELIGFDLCGDCYNTRSKRPGRFNQQHTPEHRFELVKQPTPLQNIMLRMVGGQLVDSSGAPILAISATEDSPDGWIPVDHREAFLQIDDSVLATDGSNAESTHNNNDGSNAGSMNDNNQQDLSIPFHSTNASDDSGDNGASPADSDVNSEERNGNGSQSAAS